jgi:hypothetical protein
VRAAIAAAFALALAGASAGCGNFQDVSTVLDLRVLSIDTDPSEIILSTTADFSTSPPTITIDPATDLSFDIQALLPDPPADAAGKAVTWTLVGCPNNPYGAAPPAGQGGAAMLGGARTTVGSGLCPDDPTLTWPLITEADAASAGDTRTIRIDPADLVTAFSRDIYIDQFGDYHGGFDLGEPLALQLTATDGTHTINAVKRVLFWANRISPDQVANVIPIIPEIVTYARRDDATFEPIGAVTPVVEGDPVVVKTGGTAWLQPILGDGTAQPYVTTVIDPDTHMAVPDHVVRERIRYAFYATAGTFTPPRTVNELPTGFVAIGPNPIHLESQYTAPASIDGLPPDGAGHGMVTVWITVRDERGGESWVTRQIAVEP